MSQENITHDVNNISGNRIFVDISSLKPYPRNNYFFDDITGVDWDNLIKSIKEIGLQEPIIITKDNMIVSGHQRVRACKELGIDTVEAVYREYATEDDLTRAVIEINIIQRGVGNPNPVKFGRCIKELERIYGIKQGRGGDTSNPHGVGWTQEDLAEKLHMSTETIRRYKQLADTIPEIQELIIDGKISPKAARALAKRLSQDEQLELIESLDATKKYTAKEIDTAVQEYKSQLSAKDAEIDATISQYKSQIAAKDAQIEEDRQKYNDFVKQRDEKFSRERDKLNKELKSKDVEIERLYANPPKPADYDSTKKQNVLLQDKIEILNDRMRQLQSQVDAYNGQAAHFTASSDEYKRAQKKLEETKSKLESLTKEFKSQNELSALTVVMDDMIRNKLAPIKFMECLNSMSENPVIAKNLKNIFNAVDQWVSEMRPIIINIHTPDESNNRAFNEDNVVWEVGDENQYAVYS